MAVFGGELGTHDNETVLTRWFQGENSDFEKPIVCKWEVNSTVITTGNKFTATPSNAPDS